MPINKQTVASQLNGRFISIPTAGEAAMEERVAIVSHNIKAMRECLGHVPPPYPGDADDNIGIREWLEQQDRVTNCIDEALTIFRKMG